MVLIVVRRDRRLVPRRLRVDEQRLDALALDVRRRRQAAHVRQRREDGHEVHRAVADGARPSQPRHNPDQRRPRRLLPQRELPPVVLFA